MPNKYKPQNNKNNGNLKMTYKTNRIFSTRHTHSTESLLVKKLALSTT